MPEKSHKDLCKKCFLHMTRVSTLSLQRKGEDPVDWLHQSKCAHAQDGCNLLDGDKNKALTKRKLKEN